MWLNGYIAKIIRFQSFWAEAAIPVLLQAITLVLKLSRITEAGKQKI